jgi:hypothetical protein
VRETNPVVALACSDLHLCHVKPIARAEKDWYEVMENYLWQLSELQKKHKCPVLIAGDIFDRWNSCPELINMAIRAMPDRVYAVPGQHDLPYHNFGNLRKSAFGSLVLANRIELLKPGETVAVRNNVAVTGFPWGSPITPPNSPGSLQVAVIHAYVWATKNTTYPGAPANRRVTDSFLKQSLADYDVAVVGDNHKGFLYVPPKKGTTIFNCGCFIRRKLDEGYSKPCVGLIHQSGKVIPHYLDVSKDKFMDRILLDQKLHEAFDASVFVKLLKGVSSTGSFDFERLIRNAVEERDLNDDVRKELLTILETVL